MWRRFGFGQQQPADRARLTCYTRPGCCLCDQAHLALDRLARRGLVAVTYVSIEGNPLLEEAYGARIPVVMLGDRVLAEGKVSEVWLARALVTQRTAPGAPGAGA